MMLNIDDPNAKSYIRKIKVMIWKTLIMRRNGCTLTIIETFLPVIMFLGLFILQISIPQFKTEFFSETKIYESISLDLITTDLHVLYAPNTSDIKELMNTVTQNMKVGNVANFFNEKEVLNYAKALQDNGSFLKLGVVFNNYHKNSKELNYRILATSYRIGMGAAFQADPPYLQLWANDYINNGFVSLQKNIDFAFIDKKSNNKLSQQNINIKLENMPTPPHEIVNTDKFIVGLISFSYLLILMVSVLPYIITEKSTGIKQIMLVMGMDFWQYWLGWFLYTFFAYIFNVTLLTFLLTINFTDNLPTFFDNSNGFIIWLFIFDFYICTVMVAFFLSSVFKINQYAQAVSILWLFIGVYSYLISPESIPFSVNILLMLIPIVNLIFGVYTISELEKIGGVHFNNLFSSPSVYSNAPSIGLCLIMFTFDAIIYFILAWYIDNICPGQFGVPKRKKFIFQKSFWTSTTETAAEITNVFALKSKPEIETGRNLNAGIIIRNLKKKYQYLYAVDDFNIDLYSNHITVLLGHNGAGKTTTIGIITGMIPLTSGKVVVNGYDIETNLSTVQKSLGLCQQNNTEIPNLTVLEHLLFFAMLRGYLMSEAKAEALEFLEKANLKDKANKQPVSLSGAMKRKLSIGMAMIGNSKVVLLDEPTSGLDPQSRRDLWDFLLATRGERTILITTHYMEEADVLGDRIAIMHSGHLMCYGSSLFLKNYYGTGYTLSVVFRKGDSSATLGLIKSHVPSAFVKSFKGESVIYSLPTNNTSTLSKLVLALEKNKLSLGINAFGICITSLEDVFLKVGEIADAAKGITKIDHNFIQSDDELTREFSPKILLTLKALCYKRLHYYRHNKLKTIFTVLYSLIAFLWFIFVMYIVTKSGEDNLIVDLKLDMYDQAESFYSCESGTFTDSITKYYKNIVSEHGGKATRAIEFYTSILNIANMDSTQYLKTLITGAQFNNDGKEIRVMFGHYAIHGAPISLNLVTNSLLHWCTSDSSYSIKVAYSPFPSMFKIINIVFALILPLGISYGIMLYACKCTLILHEENATGYKHLQQMAGVPKLIYYISALIFDYILYLFIIFAILLFIFFFDYDGPIGNSTTLGYFGYFLILYGLSYFPKSYSYTLSNCIARLPKAISDQCIESLIMYNHVIFGFATPMIAYFIFLVYPINNRSVEILFIIFNYQPQHALTYGFIKICFKSVNIHLWNQNSKFFIMTGHPCADLESEKCQEELSYYAGLLSIREQELFIYWDILIHWVLLILSDFGLISYFFQFICGAISCKICNAFKKPDVELDDDVLNEMTRVQNQIDSMPEIRNVAEREERIDQFLVKNLHKWYFGMYAVRNLYFGVKKGECFGLLGVNGAGKTTTFRILAGEIFQSAGNAYFQKFNLNRNRCNFFRNMGYSPQFDGFINDLTVHEMLYIMGSIRGIPSECIKNHIEKWLIIFEIENYEHTQCIRLSGGTKRKISSALSLIGNPKLILLDEPTSGIDPIARRNLWDVLSVLQKSGRSIILTSQSMDECEALCDRLAIMVAGQFKCIGDIQYLKSKFGYGCTIKVKFFVENTQEYLRSLNEFHARILNQIDCTLIDKYIGMLVYKVTNKDVPLSEAFLLMESLKSTYKIIEDFSISSANLEEIFLSIAKVKN